MARVGILGGTFNPPHIAHLICADQALAALGLDRVVLMPAGSPPHKAGREDPGAQRRLEMCSLATAGSPQLVVSRLELDRAGPSYTVDTLREIHASDPDDQLALIVGGDMAESLPQWREAEAILELAQLGVAERPGARREQITTRLVALTDPAKIAFLDMPLLDISSADIRRRVAAGGSIRGLVPDRVEQYIRAHGLYRQAAGEPAPRAATA